MENLEEVKLIENPPVAIVNPPMDTKQPAEVSEAIDENPKSVTGTLKKYYSEVTGGVSIWSIIAGTGGIIAAVIVPRIVKWTTGWRNLLVTAVTGAVGAFVLHRISKPAAVAFVIGAGGILLLKLGVWAMNGFKDVPLPVEGISGQPEFYGLSDEFDYGAAPERIFENAPFGESTDEIVPTANMDAFY